MRAGRAAGRADPSEDLADPHRLADPGFDLRHMPVTGRKTVAVVDLDHLAVAAAPAGSGHRAGRGGVDCLAGFAAEVDAGVHRWPAEERIEPHAESGRQVDFAFDRLSHRDRTERPGQAIDLRAGEIDAGDLAVEIAAAVRRRHGNEGTAGACRTACGGDSARIDADLGAHAAETPGLGVNALFNRIESGGLTRFNAVEGRLQEADRAVDPACRK